MMMVSPVSIVVPFVWFGVSEPVWMTSTATYCGRTVDLTLGTHICGYESRAPEPCGQLRRSRTHPRVRRRAGPVADSIVD